MDDIFTMEALAKILGEAALTPQTRAERVLALHGKAVAAAKAEAPDPRQSDAYRALQGEFDAYKAMQTARTGRDYAGVKPKFFETVYALVDRGEGAKPLREQLADIREEYEEYFVEAANPSDPAGGANPPKRGEPFRDFRVGCPTPDGRNPVVPAVVLSSGGLPLGERMTLEEAMRRANAGEPVDVGLIGK